MLRGWTPFMLGLVVLDAGAVLSAFALAYFVRFKAGLPYLSTPPYSGSFYSSLAFWSVPIWLLLFALFELYDRHRLFSGFSEYARVINACTAGLVVEVLFSFLDTGLQMSRGWLLMTWLISIVLMLSGRFSARRALTFLRRRGHYRSRVLVIGANEEARALAEQFLADPGAAAEVVGFVDPDLALGTPVLGRHRVVASFIDLRNALERLAVDEVVVASTALSREQLLDIYPVVGQVPGIELRLSSGLFEILTTGMEVREISRVPLVTPRRLRITGADAVLKAAIDYVLAA
jgi:FlaA1/EpsC-like NDP-sugar epimerase